MRFYNGLASSITTIIRREVQAKGMDYVKNNIKQYAFDLQCKESYIAKYLLKLESIK